MASNLSKSLVALVAAAELAGCAHKLVNPVPRPGYKPAPDTRSVPEGIILPGTRPQVSPPEPPGIPDDILKQYSQAPQSVVPSEPQPAPNQPAPNSQTQINSAPRPSAQTPAPPQTPAPAGYKPITIEIGPGNWRETAVLNTLFGEKTIPQIINKVADYNKISPYAKLDNGQEIKIQVNYGAKDGVVDVTLAAQSRTVRGRERNQSVATLVAQYLVNKINEHAEKNGAPLDVYSRMTYARAKEKGLADKIKSYRENGRWKSYNPSVQLSDDTAALVLAKDGIKGDVGGSRYFTLDEHLVEDTATTALNSRGYAGAIVLLPAVASSVDPGELRAAESPYKVGPSQQSPNQQSPAPADGERLPLAPGTLVARANGLNGSYHSPVLSPSASNNGAIHLVISGRGISNSDPLDKRVASLMPPANAREILREAAVQVLQHYGKI